MIKMLFSIPNKVDIAFSGGIDSLAVAHFLSKSNKDVRLLHFNHGCEFSNDIENQCRQKAEEIGLPMIVEHINAQKAPKQSQEEFWRKQRYKFLKSSDRYVITAHHLDDAIETWIWSSMHGEGKIIPYQNRNIIRPFLLTSKEDFRSYAANHNLTEVPDPFNKDMHVMRNYMREHITPHIYHINPGIDKVIRKKYLSLGKIVLKPLEECKIIEEKDRKFKI